MRLKNILKKLYPLIGILIFFWIIKDIDFVLFKNEINKINLWYLPLAALLYLPVTFFRAYRWKLLVKAQGMNYSNKESFLIIGASTLLALITPGRVGDFGKTAYIKKSGHSTGRSILSSFLEKIFDLAFVAIFCATSIFLLPLIPHFNIDYLSLIKWVLIIFLSVAILSYFFYKKITFIKNVTNDIWIDLKSYKFSQIFSIFIITAVDWFIYFLIVYVLAVSIGLHQFASFFYISFLAAFSNFAALLPISIMGIGTREAFFLFLLSPFVIEKETIIIFSLLIMINYISLALIGLFCWLKKPLI